MNPEREWNGLLSALEQMSRDYEAFRDASKEQQRALIQNDMDGLTTILTGMETLADSIFLMDSRRRMHMELLSEKSDREILNLSELAALWPALDFAPIANVAEKLRGQRAEIERLTRTNTALINSSRNLVQCTVEALIRGPGMLDPKAPKTYGANGQIQSDKKNLRNLINRKG